MLTVNPLFRVPVPPSRFVTVTLRAPSVALPETERLTTRSVEELNATLLTVIPVPENATVAPDWKPVPARLTFWFVAPRPRELGFVDVGFGRAVTVKQLVHVAEATGAGFVTVTLRSPRVAPAVSVMFAVSCVALTFVTELTVMPVPENATEPPNVPLAPPKPVPLIVTF